MTTKVQKWGNSLAVRIPKSAAGETNIRNGSKVNLVVVDGKLLISPTDKKRYRLKELVSGVTNKNKQQETDFGAAVGNEVW